MKKRIASICLILLMAVQLCGCGSYRGDMSKSDDPMTQMMPDTDDGYVENGTAEDGMVKETLPITTAAPARNR